ncbi:MAG: hypothetical protein U0271_00830 [Polyangiaceae bacterium]
MGRLPEPKRALAIALTAIAAFTWALPRASAEVRRDFACAGCILAGPDSSDADALPLVVVLHGDEGSPLKKVAAPWIAIAEASVCGDASHAHACKESERAEGRKLRVFLPKCPRSEGCDLGSWWRWDREPAWIFARIDEVRAAVAIDVDRVSLTGWSGGASYAGLELERWFARFSALALGGGGLCPNDESCIAPLADGPRAGCAPIRYLMGRFNPHFGYAEETRAAMERCHHEVDWRELPKADHAGEWRAYEASVPELAGWLIEQTRAACVAEPVKNIEPEPAASSSSPAPSAVPAPSAAPFVSAEPPPASSPRARGCTCTLHQEEPGKVGFEAPAFLAALGVLAFRRSRALGRGT